MYRLTHHATERIAERFPGIDPSQELAAAEPFGLQYGDAISLLSPCGAVWIVSDGAVVTVKTVEQYNAHLPRKLGLATVKNVARPAGATKKELRDWRKEDERERQRLLILDFAKRHAREDYRNHVGFLENYKAREKEIKAAGATNKAIKTFYREMYGEEILALRKASEAGVAAAELGE